MKSLHFSEKEIIELYLNNNISISKIAEQLKCDRGTISNLLKRNNIKIKPIGDHLRKFILNQNYFDNIDTEDKAYFLGLLFADGTNYYNNLKKKVVIDLQEEDKEILVKFSHFLYNDEFISSVKGRNGHKNQSRLAIHGKYISTKLHELGCVSNKSLVLKFPETILNLELQRHFIRGYFDGDGSISKSNRVSNNKIIDDYHASIVSTNNFCQEVIKIVNNNIDIHFTDRITTPNSQNNITHTISIRGNFQILKFMDWLYQDATIYMQRKYNKYLDLKNYVNK